MEKFIIITKKAIKNLLLSWYDTAMISVIVLMFALAVKTFLFVFGGILNTLILTFIVFGLTSFVKTFQEVINERKRSKNRKQI